jgi:hypothetical protein
MTRQGAGKLGGRPVAVEGTKLVCMECEAKFDDRETFINHKCRATDNSGTTSRSYIPPLMSKKEKSSAKAADSAGATVKPAETKKEAK